MSGTSRVAPLTDARTLTSYVEILQVRADELGSDVAYTFLVDDETEDRATFQQVDRDARAIAARLQDRGVAEGDRVLLLYPPGLDYVMAFLGCLYAGAVAVPAYPPRLNRNLSRLLSILRDARPRLALTKDAIHAQIETWVDEQPELGKVEWLSTDAVEPAIAEAWRPPNVGRDSLAFLQYTSGTTGRPKGVMVTHGNLIHNQAMMAESLGHDASTVIVSWLPLYHDMGLIGNVLCAPFHGGACHVMAPVDFLKKPIRWLRAISRHRATFSGAPDFGYALCAEKITSEELAELDLSSWKAAFNGSEPVRARTLERFVEVFESCGFRREAFFPCYGLAEGTLFAAGRFYTSPVPRFSRNGLLEGRAETPEDEEDEGTLVSCGTAPLDAQMVVVDPETRTKLPEGRVGEIWLSGPSVAKGYWGRPKTTREVFEAQVQGVEDRRYLRTGDLGFVHGGELFITGRSKDLLIIRGKNHYPQDIELTIETCHPTLRPGFAAVFSYEQDGAERLGAVVEVKREERHDLDAEAVIAQIRRAVSQEHGVALSAVSLLRPAQVPKTSSGKTQRTAAKKAFLERRFKALAEWASTVREPARKPTAAAVPAAETPPIPSSEEIQGWIVEFIAQQLSCPPQSIDLKSPLADQPLESMAWIELAGRLEDRLGRRVEIEELMVGEPTLEEIARTLHATAEGRVDVVPEVEAARDPEPPSPPRRRKTTYRPPEMPPDAPAFDRFVNPELGRLLRQMGMDRRFVRGEGCYLYDEEGQRYLDFLAQYGALPFGFNPPRIWEALLQAQNHLEPSFVQPSILDAAGELAKRLLDVAPDGLSYVTYANSGAEAVEAAIKLCRSTTGRQRILATHNAFHGKTLGALSATPKKKYQRPFGVPFPDFDYVPYGDARALARALASKEYAAFLVEPIQGEGGIVEPPEDYLQEVSELCQQAGTLWVADEIQTGLGRTGVLFACDSAGVTPDVMTLAKALGGGLLPIGACLCTREAYNQDFALNHTSTFAGNALSCRAALATVELLTENDGALVRSVEANGRYLKEELHRFRRRHPDLLAAIRGRGYMLGVRFALDRYNGGEGILGYVCEGDHLAELAVSNMLHHEKVRVGYTLNEGGVMRIEPPLVAGREECDLFLESFARVLDRLARRSTAHFTAHLSGWTPTTDPAPPANGSPDPQALREVREPREEDGRFAFVVHPLDLSDYVDLDSSLAQLDSSNLECLSKVIGDNFDPFVIGEARIVSPTGRSAYGEFILVPRLAHELQAMPRRQAVEEIQEAVALARRRGARMVGLGAFTSVVTGGGLSLGSTGRPAVTTGNSYTASTGRRALHLALDAQGKSASACSVAILGATGAIGRTLTLLLSAEVSRLILLGNPAHPGRARTQMLDVAAQILRRTWSLFDQGAELPDTSLVSHALALRPSSDPDPGELRRLADRWAGDSSTLHVSCDARRWLPEADAVLTATSAVEALVQAEDLHPEAVVVDIARPANVGQDVVERRPDVLITDGGVVRLPAGAELGLRTSLGPNRVYACMAETMLLALEERYTDHSLGPDLALGAARDMERLAARHGFEVVLHEPAPREWQISGDEGTAAEVMTSV